MPNHLSDNNDLLFYLNAADARHLFTSLGDVGSDEKDELGSPHLSHLERIGELAAVSFAPRALAVDTEGFGTSDGDNEASGDGAPNVGPSLERSIDELRALGSPHLPLSRDGSGASAALAIQLIETELVARAEPSIAIQNNLYGGFSMALTIGACEAERAGLSKSAAHLRELADRAASKEIFGAIALRAPHDEWGNSPKGCVAEHIEGARYRLKGERHFVVGAGAPYILALAEDESAEAGEKGERISFFLINAEEERKAGRLRISNVLRRFGLRGVPSATLEFHGAIGERVGGERSGARLLSIYEAGMTLFHAFECVGVAEAAFRAGMKYAWETPFRGKALIHHELMAATLEELELDLRSMRALAMTTAWHQRAVIESYLRFGLPNEGEGAQGSAGEKGEAPQKAERSDTDELQHHRDRARRLGTYFKYYVDAKLLEITRRVAQFRGAEALCEGAIEAKHLRDAAALPFDEGISRTESLIAMIKDTVGALLKNPQAHVRQGARARWRTVSPRHPLEKRVARLDLLGQNAQQHLLLRTAGEKMKGLRDRPISEWTAELTRSWDPERDFAFATIHAERLTRLLAEIGIAEIFLAQYLDDPGRRELLERHLERAEPLARMLYEELSIRGKRIIDEADYT